MTSIFSPVTYGEHRGWAFTEYLTPVPPIRVGTLAETVNAALQAAPIEHVAVEPAPHCILMDLHESFGRYAVRYWLTDLARDDPTDSVIVCESLS